jgi:hypothetical protein
VELSKYTPHLRHVIELQQELSLDVRQKPSHVHIILFLEIELVERLIEIRRVEIEEGRLPVTFLEYLLIRQAFELNIEQSLMCLANELRERLRVVI